MTSPDQPGSPEDAVKPLADALVSAGKAAAKAPAADPKVTAAVRLGWLMEDLVVGAPFDVLDGEPISDAASFKAQGRRLTATLTVLALPDLDPATVTTPLGLGTAAAPAATAWEADLLAALLGEKIALLRAYRLGRHVSAIKRGPYPPSLFKSPAIDQALVILDDLSTGLPAHVGRAVAHSMARWVAEASDDEVARLLPAQVELWRLLLTGEKDPTELLEPENYLDAAERLGGKLTDTAKLALYRMPGLVALVLALVVAGVLTVALTSSGGGASAGIASLLAAVGLTWKGIGGTVGKLVGKLEAPLWGAELDTAVTDAVTLVGAQRSSTDSTQGRRAKILSGDYAGRRHRARTTAATLPPVTPPPAPGA